MTTLVRRWQVLLTAAILGGALSVAEYISGVPVVAALWMYVFIVGYALVITLLQRRSETASALAGHPVDERWSLIHERALALSAQVGAVVALGGFLVTELARHDAWQFGTVAAAIGGSYIAGVVIYRSRL